MTFPHFWSDDEVARYFPVEALTKDPAIFRQVHVPIDRIEVDAARSIRIPHEVKSVDRQRVLLTSEDKVLEFIRRSKPEDPNRIIMVVGETGSGKSELCQSLAYALEGDNQHIPILIKRSRTKLRDIVQAIEGALGAPVTEPRELEHVSPEQFSASIKFALLEYIDSVAAATAFGPNVDTLRQIIALPVFEEKIQEVYERYREEIARPGGARRPDLLPLETFLQLTGIAHREHHLTLMRYPPDITESPVRYAYQRLEPKVRESLARFLNIDDLLDKVRRLSDQFARDGRRPVLLIEDITTFGFLQNDLLDYLFDLSSGHFDVVLGITTEFERFNQENRLGPLSTVRDRLEARLLLSRQGGTLFAESKYQELARLHLQAVVHPPSPLPSWWGVFDGDYPLHPLAIQRIWNGLQEGGSAKRTPRLLLRVIRTVLEDERLPADVLAGLAGALLRAPNVDPALSAAISLPLRNLAMWYGYPCRDGIFLPEDMLIAFGIPADGSRVAGGWVVLPLAPALRDLYTTCEPPTDTGPITVSPPKPPPPDDLPGTVGVGSGTPGPQSPPSPRPDVLLEARDALLRWLETGREFAYREILARGILATLEYFQLDPFTLARPGAIAGSGRSVTIRARTTPESRIAFEGLTQDRDVTRLLIPRRRYDQAVLEYMLRLGNHDDRADRLAHDPDLPRVALQQYLEARVIETQTRGAAELERFLGGVSIPEIASLAQLLLLSGLGRIAISGSSGATDLSQAVVSPHDDDTLYQAPDSMLHPHWGQFYRHAAVWNSLFVATFYLQVSFLDYDRLDSCYHHLTDQTAFMDLLQRVSRADTQALATRFTLVVQSDRENPFADAVSDLQGYIRALKLWLAKEPKAALAKTVATTSALLPQPAELGRLLTLADDLIGFQTSRPYMRESWRRAGEILKEDNAAQDLLTLRRQLKSINDALAHPHPANIVAAAQKLRRLQTVPIMDGIMALADLTSYIAKDRSLDLQSSEGHFAHLSDLMQRLQQVVT